MLLLGVALQLAQPTPAAASTGPTGLHLEIDWGAIGRGLLISTWVPFSVTDGYFMSRGEPLPITVAMPQLLVPGLGSLLVTYHCGPASPWGLASLVASGWFTTHAVISLAHARASPAEPSRVTFRMAPTRDGLSVDTRVRF